MPCEFCYKSKQTGEPFPLSKHKYNVLGDFIHLDVWGPYKVNALGSFRFFLTIVDDFNRATWIYLTKSKEEVFFLLSWFCMFFGNSV